MFAPNETGTDTQLPVEELEKDAPALPELPDDNATPEQIKAYKSAVQSLPARLAHWRTKAGTLANDPRLKVEIKKPETQNDNAGVADLQKDVATLKQSEEKRQFGSKHNLSSDETDRLFAFAGAGDKEEALKSEFFQDALTANRRRKQNGNAIPNSSNRRPVVEGKEWDKMPEKDKRANFGTFIGAVSKKNRG